MRGRRDHRGHLRRRHFTGGWHDEHGRERGVHADHASYLRYATPYNFLAAGIGAVLFLVVGLLG